MSCPVYPSAFFTRSGDIGVSRSRTPVVRDALTEPEPRQEEMEEEIVSNLKSSARVGAALVFLSILFPAGAKAEDYSNSTDHFEALRRAGGGTKIPFDKLPDWIGLDGPAGFG
jgi:hypothetical protein